MQEHGAEPAPSFRPVEPAEVVEAEKARGNGHFGAGEHGLAVEAYSEALRVAAECEGATGLDESLLARVHANRAEALLQRGELDACAADAEAAIDLDPTFLKGCVPLSSAPRWHRKAAWPPPAAQVTTMANACDLVTCTHRYVRRAKALHGLSRREEAAACLRDALEVSPGSCGCMLAW